MGIDYTEIAKAGGLAKVTYTKQKDQKKESGEIGPVPLWVKEESIKLHGNRCYCGECGVCKGKPITVNDDPDHEPSKGAHNTPNDPRCIFMARRLCHSYYTDHPKERKELFSRIAAKGILVLEDKPNRKGIANGRKVGKD
jgi:hypothetical protein